MVVSELKRLGMEVSLVPSTDMNDFAAEIRDNTRLLYVETPANPLLNVVDLREAAALARDHGLYSVMDNTFATPINQNPLDLGIDVVVHSGTKYLGGHSDLCCGAIATRADLMERIRETAVNYGMVQSPYDAYRLERSMKTLGLRVRQQNANGRLLAEFLNAHPLAKKVYYPGLPGHPNHDVAKKQMRDFGGMLSVDLDMDVPAAHAFVERLRLFIHAVSLGGVESLICFPVLTSHEKVPREEREKIGITDTLIRISAGVEDASDLIDDMKQALESVA